MTDSEFLDSIERRGINSDVFTEEEIHRLWTLAGRRIPIQTIHRRYMRNRANALVTEARKRFKDQAIKRIKESK
jgi:hypothetical protein